jgi:Tfp pilus assembly protein PilN/Tfp pilus assembly PilM family ATPase
LPLRRTSIELHPDGCRVVVVRSGSATSRGASADVRVERFVSELAGLGQGDDVALASALRALRETGKFPREAVVTIWGLRTTQHFLRLPPAKPEVLTALAAREARKDIAPLEIDNQGAVVATALGDEVQVGAHRRREVSLVAASNAEVGRRIQPILDAGFVVEGVLTPALALAAMARGRRDTIAGVAGGYVAITARATALAIVRDGLLLFTREMPWGYGAEGGRDGKGEAVAGRLAAELKRSILFFKQTFRSPVEWVALCGDMPNLRSLTAPLGDALNVPVATLDSLAGFDAASLPEPADRFRADVAALRLAIAAGAEVRPPMNLLPASIRRARQGRAERVRLVAGVAAGLLITASWTMLVERTATNQQAALASLEQQVARLEPEAGRIAGLRQAHAIATAQQAALVAFDTQGPRAARVLEAISRAVPDAVVLRRITLETEGPAWRMTVSGVAVADTPASGQAALNTFLDRLSASPFAGAPVESPSLRVVSAASATRPPDGTLGAASAPAGSSEEFPLPEGMSGVEFTALFRIAK